MIGWYGYSITVTAGQTTKTQTLTPPAGRIVALGITVPTLDSGAHTAKFQLNEVGNTTFIWVPDTVVSTVTSTTGYKIVRPLETSNGAIWYLQPYDPATGISCLVTLSDAQAGAETVIVHLCIETV